MAVNLFVVALDRVSENVCILLYYLFNPLERIEIERVVEDIAPLKLQTLHFG